MKPHSPAHHPYATPRAALENTHESRKEAWGRLAASGWKVFWLMVPVAGILFFFLSDVITRSGELAPLLALLVHGRLAYLLLPLAAPALTIAAFRMRHRPQVDPLRFVALLHSLLAAYVLLAVVVICLVDLLK